MVGPLWSRGTTPMSRAAAVLILLAGLIAPSEGGLIVVSGSGPLPPEVLAAVADGAALVGAHAAVVHTGTLRLLALTRRGVDVQRPVPGFGYPMDVSAVAPELAGSPLRSPLRRDEAVLSEISAGLHGARVGDTLTLEGWDGAVVDVVVGAIEPDDALGWSEIVLPLGLGTRLGIERPSRVEIRDAADVGVARLAVESFLPDDAAMTVTIGEPPRPVLPSAVLKERFGEFSFRPHTTDDGIDIDETWLDANIVTVDLPLLGTFRCHRLVVPYLRRAVGDIVSRRLDWLIDPVDFQRAGGCFNPRLIRGADTGFALSRHAWGAAVDVNPSTNPFGGPARIEGRIVDVFRSWGFVWGGDWLVPDPMHMEWTTLPERPDGTGCSSLRLVRSDGDPVGWEVYPRRGTCATS